ncbi:Lrp/AsnC family transcriptional regulator [Arenibaculum pallidiluteum]|uniref:Lrp/AsnC family transcriptional regulator n=1 Tax=Arenibaculum pallidiluteum TaxID=2812559 RepID=UPI001A95EBF4|nr:Lrp/AsnC family transcriptional regulator [Arenibaculum pallidiluteum]
MTTNRRLDEIDRALLALLTANAREPAASLARKLGIARSTLQDRLDRMERDGVISGYTVRMAAEPDAELITAYVMLSINPKLADRVVRALKAIPELRALHAVSGQYDLLARICAEKTWRIDEILDRIGHIQGVERTTSSIVLSTKVER